MTKISELPEVLSVDDSDYLVADVVPITTSSTSKITRGNFLASVAGSVAKSVTKVVAPVGVVADYNTDGVADDVEIQAAISSLGSSGGKIILREGTYVLAASVIFSAGNIIIEGEGASTIINFPGNTVTTAFKMADTTQRTYIRINDLLINSTSSGNGLAWNMSHFAICSSRNLIITGCNQGIDANSNDTFYNKIEDLRIAVSGSGSFAMRFNNGANENTVVRARTGGDSNTTGLIINGSVDNSFYDYDVETGCLIGIDIQTGANHTSLYSPYLESNATNLQLASGVKNLTIIGGYIHGGTTADITDNGSIGTLYLNPYYNSNPYFYSGAQLGINLGTTSSDGLLLDIAQPVTSITRDSHKLLLRGTYFDTSGHNVTWRNYVNVTSTTGGSQMLWTDQTDSGSQVTRLSLGGNGLLTLTNALIMPSNPPATFSSAGTTGQFAWDSGFMYICVAANTWKRVAIATF